MTNQNDTANLENTENPTPATEVESSEAPVASEENSQAETPATTESKTEENTSEAKQEDKPAKKRSFRDSKDSEKRKRTVDASPEVKEFREELLSVDRVTRVTEGGRQLRFRAVMVIGDGKGRVGLGTGKSGEVVGAIAKAVNDAKKNLKTVKMEDGTVPYNIKVKYKSATIMLHQASKGTGIIAGGAARKVLDIAGFTDVIAKRTGSNNKINNARATIKALTSFK